MKRLLAVLFASALLAACGQAQLKELSPLPPPTPDYSFQTGVRGVIAANDCAAGSCHTGSLPAGSLGLDASLTCQQAYQNVMVYVNKTNATESLILTKPTNTSIPQHGGAKIFDVGSDPYDVILHWIQAGAPDDCGG